MSKAKASPEKIRELLAISQVVGVLKECDRCNGNGGFEDTTYTRSGEWGYCGICDGKGLIYSGPVSDKAKAAKAAYAEEEKRGRR